MKDTLRNILSFLFTACLILFMLLGIAIVLVQTFAMITGNGALSVAAAGTPKSIVIFLAVIAGFAGFFYSYLAQGEKKG